MNAMSVRLFCVVLPCCQRVPLPWKGLPAQICTRPPRSRCPGGASGPRPGPPLAPAAGGPGSPADHAAGDVTEGHWLDLTLGAAGWT